MERYIAFLRGINVSGQKLIKMEALRKVLADYGYADVKTFIQSGNILFSTQVQDTNIIIQTIENLIEKYFGFQTDVILRKFADIECIVSSSFFGTMQIHDGNKYYVTFLKHDLPEPLSLPFYSKNKDVEIIYQNNMLLISISTQYKGTYGFPNSFIEKLTGIPATTRNPNTLEKLLKL